MKNGLYILVWRCSHYTVPDVCSKTILLLCSNVNYKFYIILTWYGAQSMEVIGAPLWSLITRTVIPVVGLLKATKPSLPPDSIIHPENTITTTKQTSHPQSLYFEDGNKLSSALLLSKYMSSSKYTVLLSPAQSFKKSELSGELKAYLYCWTPTIRWENYHRDLQCVWMHL